MQSTGRTFDKNCTAVMKGMLIIFMLYHHLFSGDYTLHGVKLVFAPDVFNYPYFVLFGKTCVGGFAFLSAYGMMKQMMNLRGAKEFLKTVAKRLIKLESTVIFIYLVAMLYITLVLRVPIASFYTDANGFFHKHWIIIDALGLAELFRTGTFNITWWYMSAAVLIILVMPFVCVIYRFLADLSKSESAGRRFAGMQRYLILIFMLIYPFLLMENERYMNHLIVLLAAVFFGAAFAYEGWLEKLDDYRKSSIFTQIVYIAVCAAVLVICFRIGMKYVNIDRVYAPTAVVFAMLTFSYLSKIPYLNRALAFLGKYSGDIFMIHTLIYYYYYPDFIYSFRYDIVILLVLLGCSLGVSILIGLLRKVTRYDKLVGKLMAMIGR